MVAVEGADTIGCTLGRLRSFHSAADFAAHGLTQGLRHWQFGVEAAMVNRGENREKGLAVADRDGVIRVLRGQCGGAYHGNGHGPQRASIQPCGDQGTPPGQIHWDKWVSDKSLRASRRRVKLSERSVEAPEKCPHRKMSPFCW